MSEFSGLSRNFEEKKAALVKFNNLTYWFFFSCLSYVGHLNKMLFKFVIGVSKECTYVVKY